MDTALNSNRNHITCILKLLRFNERRSAREKNLVNSQKGLLVVDKQIQDVNPIHRCEFFKLNSILGKVCQFHQGAFELFDLLIVRSLSGYYLSL